VSARGELAQRWAPGLAADDPTQGVLAPANASPIVALMISGGSKMETKRISIPCGD
jgi:hypothetical protein